MPDRKSLVVLVVCLLAAGALSVGLGQDANWDLRNYHLYNPWALLEGRRDLDFLASGVQFYFNPALDLPYYFVAVAWFGNSPRLVAFLAGLPYGLLVFLVLHCARAVLADMDVEPRRRVPLALLLAAFGVSGSATLSQVGTTFNEVQVAVLVIGGVAVLLAALRHAPGGSIPTRPALAAGLLFGLAAGLKLTAAIYAPAAAVALFAAARGNLRSIRTLAVFSLGWLLTFAITYGWWAAELYRELGNPFFPLLENLFPTQWLSAGSWGDHRFKPRTAAQVLAYPFSWARKQSNIVTEVEFRDARFAIAWCGVALLLAAAAVSRSGFARGPASTHTRPAPTGVFVLVFVVIAYATWQKMFSIFRYAIPIEVLLGVALAVCLVAAARLVNLALPARAGLALGIVLLVAAAATTSYPRWGRVRYGDAVLSAGPPVALQPASMVVVMGSPQSHMLRHIARDNPTVRFIGVTGDMLNARDFAFWKTAMQRIREYPGPRYAIRPLGDPFPWFNMLGDMGLAIDSTDCHTLTSNIDPTAFTLCPVHPL